MKVVIWPQTVGAWNVTLDKEEMMAMPTRPDDYLFGPTHFVFERAKDGGVTITMGVKIGDLPDYDKHYAVSR